MLGEGDLPPPPPSVAQPSLHTRPRLAMSFRVAAHRSHTALLLLLHGSFAAVLSGAPSSIASHTSSPAGRTQLLHYAVADGDTDLVRQLLANGEELEARDQSGFTPLTYAAFNGDFDMLMLLCAAGASTKAADDCGTSPLLWATLLGHSMCVYSLLQTDEGLARPGSCVTKGGCTPLMLASAANDVEVAEALLAGGVDVDEPGRFSLTPLQLATSFGHENMAELLRAHGAMHRPIEQPSTHPEPVFVRTTTAAALAANDGVALWRQAFAESTPLYVHGLGRQWSERISHLSPDELRERWGGQHVAVCFSPDEKYQAHTLASSAEAAAWQEDGPSWWLRQTPSLRMLFSEFIDALPRHGRDEFFAVQQSPSASLDEFDGLPSLPPLLERLMQLPVQPAASAEAKPGTEDDASLPPHSPSPPIPGLQSNLWVCRPPKMSQLHFDHKDSVLVQLSGTKRFTLIDPRPLDGLLAYPAELPVALLEREAAGRYKYDWEASGARSYDNFPLANVTHPCLESTPLMAYARTVTVDVKEGDALILPAYWYHQVESFAEQGKLNVAINYWWSTGAAPATWYGAVRERVRANPSARSRGRRHSAGTPGNSL